MQNVSNLWEEHCQSLNLCEIDGIVPVLALAADELTENVFVLPENYDQNTDLEAEKIEEFCKIFGRTLQKYPDLVVPQDLKPFLVQKKTKVDQKGQILMQNPLVIKKRQVAKFCREIGYFVKSVKSRNH